MFLLAFVNILWNSSAGAATEPHPLWNAGNLREDGMVHVGQDKEQVSSLRLQSAAVLTLVQKHFNDSSVEPQCCF